MRIILNKLLEVDIDRLDIFSLYFIRKIRKYQKRYKKGKLGWTQSKKGKKKVEWPSEGKKNKNGQRRKIEKEKKET